MRECRWWRSPWGEKGDLKDYSIVESSSHKILDRAALEAVKAASPFSPDSNLAQTEFDTIQSAYFLYTGGSHDDCKKSPGCFS